MSLFKFLRFKKVLRDDNKPYQEYIDRKYFKITTVMIKHNNEVKPKTLITPKGAEFIYEIVKKYINNESQNDNEKWFEII
jgi:phage antirepressor YoqD-like protein